MCSVNQHQFRRRHMCGKFSQIHPVHSHLYVTKNDLSWLNNLFMVRTQLISMSSYAKNKLQMCSVIQHHSRRRQMWGKFSQIHPIHLLFFCYKKWLVLFEQSVHGRFQLISMSSFAKNKLQMCSVTQQQCRHRQMCGKYSQIFPVLSFHLLQKMTSLD